MEVLTMASQRTSGRKGNAGERTSELDGSESKKSEENVTLCGARAELKRQEKVTMTAVKKEMKREEKRTLKGMRKRARLTEEKVLDEFENELKQRGF